MKITFVLDSFGGGGKERRCLQLVQGLNNNGYNDIQLIIVNNEIDYPEIYKTTAKIFIIDRKNSRKSYYQTYKELKKYIDSFDPNIVQGWGYLSLFFLNILRLKKQKFKYIASHVADTNVPTGINSFINKCTNILADAVIGNSEVGLKAYSVPSRKAYCFYNGFDKNRLRRLVNWDKESKINNLGIKTPYIIIMVARVCESKDYSCLVNIARAMAVQRNDITFLAVGKGPLLEKFVMETSNEKNIRFLGFREDVEELLSVSRISILCTNYKIHGEGISNSILESMALGVPVIATNSGGTVEIVENGMNGFCIDNNDVNLFVEKILYLLDNELEYNRMSKECKNTVEYKFSLEKSAREYIDFYKKFVIK